jgi:hypothetical protein
MNPLKTTLSSLLLLLILVAFIPNAHAQDSKADDQRTVKELVESKSYVFLAQSATPMSGRMLQLTSTYTVKITGDTLVCDLPYFGRVYQPTMNPSEQALTFTSYQFDYQSKIRKKGGWDVTIKTKDQSSSKKLVFTIFENGSVSLTVLSNDRQSISYRGVLKTKEN